MLALDMSFDPNFAITNTGIALYSLLCGMKPGCIQVTTNGPQVYVKIFKLFRKIYVNTLKLDHFGRNCFHHAAIVGNSLGFQLAVRLVNY